MASKEFGDKDSVSFLHKIKAADSPVSYWNNARNEVVIPHLYLSARGGLTTSSSSFQEGPWAPVHHDDLNEPYEDDDESVQFKLHEGKLRAEQDLQFQIDLANAPSPTDEWEITASNPNTDAHAVIRITP